jgi:aspartate beta-hydroxylase
MTDSADPARLLAEGRIAEAEALCERRLEEFPDDVTALNVAALGALRRREPARARDLFERSVRLAPTDAVAWHHLGRACEAIGDFPGALAADEAAVRADPCEALPRLYYARSLERQGDEARALIQFTRAIKQAQGAGLWLDAAGTPAPLRPIVEHAVLKVRNGNKALFEQLFAPLVSRYGRASLERIYTAVRMYAGEQPTIYADPNQRPTFFYIPGLPTSPYFDRRVFGWISDYEALGEVIRRELEVLLPGAGGRERVFHSDELEQANLRGDGVQPGWDGYYFYRYGKRREDNCAACPATSAALDALPLIRIRDHGPEVLFSVFAPGTHLLPHRGVTNARAVSHLPLIVPPDCALSVGGQEHAWRVGRTVVFDDTYEHEAWNRSGETRVVLIADLWNPYLSEAECAAVADVIAAIGDLRAAAEVD